MTSSRNRDVTTLLQAWARGDGDALDGPVPLIYVIYGELHAQVERAIRSRPPGHPLQATSLVHETWLRLVDAPETDRQGRAHSLGGGERGETASRRG